MDVIQMSDISRKNIQKSQGSLMMKELHLNAIGQLHITFRDKDGNLVDLDLDPVSQPIIKPAGKKEDEANGEG